MLLDGAFTALLLLVSAVCAVTVLPPTNVTVSCQNLKVRVSWEYSEQQQAKFNVHIQGSEGQHESSTTDHHYDLTHFIWASEERYMDSYQVTLTAIVGNNQSEPVKSDTFSFNDLKTTVKTCELDFPPVDVNAEGSGATVSFRNPLHFYRELKQAAKQKTASFQFTVSSDDKDFKESCSVEQITCRCDVSFLDGSKSVKVKGLLVKGNDVGEILFRETELIYVHESAEIHVIVLVTLLSIAFLIISVAAFIICRLKVWTMAKDERQPVFLLPDPSTLPPNTQADPEFADVTVEINPPHTNLSVSFDEENAPAENVQDRSAASDVRPHDDYTDGGCLESSDQELEATGLLSNGHRSDDDSADDSVNTECVSMHFEEEEQVGSGYDCRH